MAEDMLDPPDPTTREGAEALCRKLNDYWHRLGHTQVEHWIEPQRLLTRRAPRNGEAIWVVRSNLVRGQPPRSTGGTAA